MGGISKELSGYVRLVDWVGHEPNIYVGFTSCKNELTSIFDVSMYNKYNIFKEMTLF